MARSGRKRKQGQPRNPQGKILSRVYVERPEDAQKQGVEARQRVFGIVDAEIAKSALVGFPLGRLLMQGQIEPLFGITSRQFDAGRRFESLHVNYCTTHGASLPPIRTSTGEGGGGRSCTPDTDPEVALKLRQRWQDARSTVLDAVGPGGFQILVDATVGEREPQGIVRIGTLRLALNALAHLWR